MIAVREDVAHIVATARPPLSLEVQRLLTRWVQALAVASSLAAELLAAMPATKGASSSASTARAGVDAARDERTTSRRAADDPISVMLRKGQIDGRAYLTAREVQHMLDMQRAADGVRSGLANFGERVDGGGDLAADAEVRRLTRADRWARLAAAILADPRAGAVEHRPHVVETLARVCGGPMSIADVARMGDLGRRAVIARRFRAGLAVAADHVLRGRDARGGVVHVDVDMSPVIVPAAEAA